MDQFEECGVNEFLITLDSALNNIPQSASSISSLGTQLTLGRENADTSIYIAKAAYNEAREAEDFEEVGLAIGLAISQILKFEGGRSIEVAPTSS